ncbi:BACK domain-containing protein [Balamuthia mandrillaris]
MSAAGRMLAPSGGQPKEKAHAAADESGAGKQLRSKEEAWLDGIINSPGSPLSRRMLKRKRSFKAATPSLSETANGTEESRASDVPVSKEKGGGAASGDDNPNQQAQQQTSTKKTKKPKKKGKKKKSSASLVEPAAQPTHKENGEGGQQRHNETVENGAQGSNNSPTEDAPSAAAAVAQLEGIVDKLMERHNPNAPSSSSPPSDNNNNNDQPQQQLSRQQLRKERTIKQRAEAVEEDLTSLVYSILMPLFSLNYSLRDLVDFDDVASSPADLPPQLRALLSSSPSTAANNAQNKRPTKKQRTKSKNDDEEKQPGKLKKPRSAYHFFCLEYGPIIQSESERPLGFGERAKLLGAKWRQVCEEGGALKQKFDEQAEEDRERYLREALELSTEDGGEGSGNTNAGKARSRSGSERRKSLSTTDPASLMKMLEKEGPILIRPRRMSGELLEELGKQAVLVDITPSSTDNRWRKFGLAYPHGMIPIPGHENKWSMSVEGLYEGLKVFERAGVDRSVMTKTSMKGLRRQEHRNGPLLGWATSLKQKPTKLMAVKEARWKLLLPAYKTVLERHLLEEVAELRQMLDEGKRLVILDGQTNTDLCNYEKDVSAAALLKRYLEGRWPSSEEKEQEELQRRRSKEEEEKQKEKGKGKGKEVAATVENRTKQTEGHSDKKEKKYEEAEEEKQKGKSSMQLEERGEGGSSTGALSLKKKKRGSKRKRETVPPLTLQKI